MTIEIDDAGVGDLLYGVVIGAYRPETREFFYEMIDVKFFQPPLFRSKGYLTQASAIVKQLTERMKILEGEQIVICSLPLAERTTQKLSSGSPSALDPVRRSSSVWRRACALAETAGD